MVVQLKQIGVIETAFSEARGTPVQPVMGKDATGIVRVFPEYAEALSDLGGFERIWLVYWFHRAAGARLCVKPYMAEDECSLFATRAPCRPNPIGISTVRLVAVEETQLRVQEIDILDGTPLLDIKPYVPRFDSYPAAAAGWLDRAGVNVREDMTADERFNIP